MRGERQASEASSAAPGHWQYCLNHLPLPPAVEKLSSTKSVPGAKKTGYCWVRGHEVNLCLSCGEKAQLSLCSSLPSTGELESLSSFEFI